MKNKILNRKLLTTFSTSFAISLMTNGTVYAEQVGIPEPSIIVSQQNSAADANDCGTNNTPPCRTIQHAVNRIAINGSITVSAGTYIENILVDKAGITINSLDSSQVTTIDGSAATNETVSEAIRIIADGVTIGLENSPDNGFTFQNSVASGLFSIGNSVTISGNMAINNGERGFQFGLSTIDDLINNNPKNIVDDPLNGATFVAGNGGNATLQTQSNVTVIENTANNNALGGFYFSAFDNSFVSENESNNNRGVARLGLGSGFWIDSGSDQVTLERNRASSNSGNGIFYRRGGGNAPAGVINDQRAIGNIVSSNGRHGIIFMGNNIIAQGNISESNQQSGFHFMGYDRVLDISFNTIRGNLGAGIGFENGLFNNNINAPVGEPVVSDLNFDPNGTPIQLGGIHNNSITGNRSHNVPGLANSLTNCGIATNLSNGTIQLADNDFGNDQVICDEFGVVIGISLQI